VVDAAGVVRAANRPAREYLGLRSDPRGSALAEVLGADALREFRDTATRLGESDGTRYEELELSRAEVSLRLRIAVRTIRQAEQPIGRVILLREISHEPLRRRFEEVLHEIRSASGEVRARLEQAQQELAECAARVNAWGVESPGMIELGERISRTRTAIEHWLAIDDALVREGYPDAQLLRDRMRIGCRAGRCPRICPSAFANWPGASSRTTRRGENPGQPVL